MKAELSIGLLLAIVTVFLLPTANLQSLRLAFVTASMTLSVMTHVVVMLYLINTRIHIGTWRGCLVTLRNRRHRRGRLAQSSSFTGWTVQKFEAERLQNANQAPQAMHG